MSVVPSSVPVGELAPITGLIGDKVGRAAIHSGALATVDAAVRPAGIGPSPPERSGGGA